MLGHWQFTAWQVMCFVVSVGSDALPCTLCQVTTVSKVNRQVSEETRPMELSELKQI